MNRRDLILKQLGLSPLWIPRPGRHPLTPVQTGAGLLDIPVDCHEPPVTNHESPVTNHESRESSEDRKQRIARMQWPELKEAVRSCAACPLHAARKQSVFGVGDEQADWLFVGEGPGAEEDARGEPFVGQAGRLLDNMLAAIDLKRGRDVYVANIVKCRPPGNRVPEPQEAEQCEPFLVRQFELIAPKLIVALGKTAASNLLRTDASIGSLRGRLHEFHGTPVLVTYHPAYLLRNLPDKAKAWEDLCLARDTMSGLKARAAAPN
jgi:DNA polymerase